MILVEFLRARYDEDEAAPLATRASGKEWRVDVEPWATNGVGIVDERDQGVAVGIGDHVAKHIARYDPARVLAEVDAKRRIVDEYEKAVQEWRETVSGEGEWARGESSRALHQLTGRLIALELVVRHHTTVYDSHPDYREEWRP